MNSTPNDVFDEWYSDTHGGTEDFEMESDVDEIVSDISFDDPESYWYKKPPTTEGGFCYWGYKAYIIFFPNSSPQIK